MAGSFSDFWEDTVLNHIFRKGTEYTPPANIFVALSTTDPTDSGGDVTEPGVFNYARVQTAPSDWSTATLGFVNNVNSIVFPVASGAWGTIIAFALYDASTGGNMLAYGMLNSDKIVGDTDTVQFNAESLTVSLD